MWASLVFEWQHRWTQTWMASCGHGDCRSHRTIKCFNFYSDVGSHLWGLVRKQINGANCGFTRLGDMKNGWTLNMFWYSCQGLPIDWTWAVKRGINKYLSNWKEWNCHKIEKSWENWGEKGGKHKPQRSRYIPELGRKCVKRQGGRPQGRIL